MTPPTPLIVAEDLSKAYRMGDVMVVALDALTVRIAPGTLAAFVGPSGSGKSTVLNLLGGLARPTRGRLTVAGVELATLGPRDAAAFRARHVGFIFQDFNLLPVLTVYENVEYPLVMVQSWPAGRRRRQVLELLDAVGMAAHADKRPDQLSGGQRQRVAIARALVATPELVLADEPTANLDTETARQILGVMKQMRDARGTTFVFSTHDPRVVAEADLVFALEDGRLIRTEVKEDRACPTC